MPAARAHLESLLRARKLDVTLPSSRPLVADEATVAPSGLAALDARLGGGWPRGQVSELVGPRSSGRTWLMTHALVAATGRGELAALVDALDAFDPASAAPLAPHWAHVLWVRGRAPSHTRLAPGRDALSPAEWMERAVDRAIKAAALVLQAGGFGAVALDLGDVPIAALRRLPFTTWLRLQRLVEGHDTACLLVAPESLGRSAGGVTVRLGAAGDEPGVWRGSAGGRRLDGVPARGRIVRTRWHADDEEAFAITHEGSRLATGDWRPRADTEPVGLTRASGGTVRAVRPSEEDARVRLERGCVPLAAHRQSSGSEE